MPLKRKREPTKAVRRSDEEMHAALDVNIPNYASAIVTTHEIVDSLSSVRA